jgi:hypothetical protein
MKNIVMPPTPDIEKACDLLENWIHSFLEARDSIPSFGEFEAPIESLNLMYLMIRNVESIILMARHDLVVLPSAMHLARSVFEMAMKARWILSPNDVFQREVRWLAQLQTEERYFDRFAQRLSKIGVDNTDAIKIRDNISGFRLDVTDVLPQPYKPLSEIPNLADMMKDIQEEQKYITYLLLSQYSHGTHVATGTYTAGLGNDKVLGEYITPKTWEIVFSVCWYCLAKTGERIFVVFEGDTKTFMNSDIIQEVENTIQKIKAS